MHVRILDLKVQKELKKDAKARGGSAARAAEIALSIHYFNKRFLCVYGVKPKKK